MFHGAGEAVSIDFFIFQLFAHFVLRSIFIICLFYSSISNRYIYYFDLVLFINHPHIHQIRRDLITYLLVEFGVGILVYIANNLYFTGYYYIIDSGASYNG